MYHVNPKTGEVGTCHAKSPETCPFGSFNHSDNLDGMLLLKIISLTIKRENLIKKELKNLLIKVLHLFIL